MNATHLVMQIAARLEPTYGNATTAQAIAWHLICAATHQSKTHLIRSQYVLTPVQLNVVHRWVEEHLLHEKPIAYIIGSVPFGEVTIDTPAPLLIPRPETEHWVYALIEQIKKHHYMHERGDILDLCTGTGCIAIALAHALPHANITAVDIDQIAIKCTQLNAQKNNVKNVHAIQSDLFEKLQGKTFDLIVSNPPYIDIEIKDTIDKSVTQWENHHALFAGENGFELIEKIIAQAPHFLKPQTTRDTHVPSLIIEIGHTQGAATRTLLEKAGFADIMLTQDYNGHDRVVSARYVK
jgi:release factor glutamine methyltransferase